MLNIVHDNLPLSNVWFAPKIPDHIGFSLQHNKPLPSFLHIHNDLTFHSSADGLDSFIYPIVMADSYIQVRSLIMNHNPFGFWAHVSDSVIKGLREKRGWIIIDICSEPITNHDFDNVLNALSDSSLFPNDRVLLNTASPDFVDNIRVFDHPSWLEMGCYITEFQNGFRPCYCHQENIKRLDPYPHKRLLLLNNHIDYTAARLFANYASKFPDSFLDSSDTIPGKNDLLLPNALYATDLNVVLEAYTDSDTIEYAFMTEKIFRNIKYKKPFVVVGQQHTLSAFRKLGYKTFHTLFDESYDTYNNTRQRCTEVMKLLEWLRLLSDDNWGELLANCQPILDHNYDNLMSRINQTNAWLENLKNL